jgi:hypothetical protein
VATRRGLQQPRKLEEFDEIDYVGIVVDADDLPDDHGSATTVT